MLRKILTFFHKETVLSISAILAILSMFIVHPSGKYFSYIDFRTLSLLFCLMSIVAGLSEIGLFDYLAEKILSRANSIKSIIVLLVLLCFFFSMIITNDVALITFVPLAIIILKKMSEKQKNYWILRTVVMQTIAANLGSMLTPIGNPQNLYLYARANMSALALIRLMLPYSIAALVLLLVWIQIAAHREPGSTTENHISELFSIHKTKAPNQTSLIGYLILFLICLLVVAHIIDYRISFILAIGYIFFKNWHLFKKVDYSLLLTFTALFIFIGNLKCIPQFNHFLISIIDGHETLTAILSSQIISNVPAAILLSGFTKNYSALIIGTNIGGLGTLIASMASLISFKYIAKEKTTLRGKYFMMFTIANIVFLILLLLCINLL